MQFNNFFILFFFLLLLNLFVFFNTTASKMAHLLEKKSVMNVQKDHGINLLLI